MKQMNVKWWTCLVVLLLATHSAVGTSDTSRSKFEEKYQAWKKWVEDNWTMPTLVWNKPFDDIVSLGPSALPYIIEKIETVPEDFHLQRAVRRIAKMDFENNEWPANALGDSVSASKMCVRWWKEGRFKTGERFAELHGKWKSLKSEKKDKEAEEAYQRIVNLGIPVLPYLVDNVERHPELIVAISKLTDNALPASATVTECKQWWDRNKTKYELPPPAIK